MCPDAEILKEILKSERANGWMGQTWFTSNILEPLIIFGFCSESNPFVDAFSHKFFRRSKVNKPKQSMWMLPHLSLPCPIGDWAFLVMTFCSKSANSPRHWSFVTIAFKSTLKWPGWSWDCPMACRLIYKKGFRQRRFSPRSVLTRQAV